MNTKTEKKHTALPWKVENNGQDDIWISDEKDNTVVEQFYHEKSAQANAEFIVKAVNAHYELVEALRKGEDIISGLEAQADNAGINLEEVRHWWQSAKQALEKAGA